MRPVPEKYLVKESDILAKEGIFVHTPSPFAKENLYYVQLEALYTCGPRYDVRRTGLDSYLLFYLKEGEMLFTYEGHSFTARPGDVVFLDCRRPHRYRAMTVTKFYWFHFDGGASRAFFDHFTEGWRIPDRIKEKDTLRSDPAGNAHAADNPETEKDAAKAAKTQKTESGGKESADRKAQNSESAGRGFPGKGIHFRDFRKMEEPFVLLHDLMRNDFQDEGIMSVHVHRILAMLYSGTGRDGSLSVGVSRAKQYMDEHYMQKISTQDVADASLLSASRLSRLFKEETGLAPYGYLMNIRMNHAMKMLLETPYTVDEIAEYCAFCSSANFIRAFRQSTGTTPKKFRRLISGMTSEM
ncbi:MAG: helix-turn-helix domain-containing protein [Eubacteriales bacterium]|nr:helix-turn-helix domain-containing protein [Eubacteriales bacterium]